MAQLCIIYDERRPPMRFMLPEVSSIRMATLPIPDGLENRDIYEVARKLAELLLEQLQD